jgi:metal-sulfur cluster biosynthetic enzyme
MSVDAVTGRAEVVRDEVERVLAQVLDPCSVTMGRPLDLVSMGLVESITVCDGRVGVSLVLTDPMCFVQAEILRAVEEAVVAVSGVRECEATIDGDVLWMPDRMKPGTAETHERRTRRIAEIRERRRIRTGS